MKAFTDARDASTPDQCWLLEHEPVLPRARRAVPSMCLPRVIFPLSRSIVVAR